MAVPDVRSRGFKGRADPAEMTRLIANRLQKLEAERVSTENGDGRIAAGDIPAETAFTGAEVFKDASPKVIVPAGTVLIRAGERLCPMNLATLALAGVREISVVRRPTVDLLITGNELLPCDSKPRGYQIVDSNSVMLAALVRRDGGRPLPSRLIADELETLRNGLRDSSADVVLVSGGSSVGKEDYAAEALNSVGELSIHGVSMRPGGPVGLGFIGRQPVFLLPGNPVACLCAYDLFAGQAIRRLGGAATDLPYPSLSLPLGQPIKSMFGRLDYVRVRIQDGQIMPMTSMKGSGASILSSTTLADGFVLVPAEVEAVRAGENVQVYLYGDVETHRLDHHA